MRVREILSYLLMQKTDNRYSSWGRKFLNFSWGAGRGNNGLFQGYSLPGRAHYYKA